MRLNLFWKFAFSFLALLVSVLLAVDFFAERALRSDYERTGFEKLAAIARIAQKLPPKWTPASPDHPEDLSGVREWVAQMGASGARMLITLIHDLRRRGGGLGVAAMCAGGGQAGAVLIEV